MTHADHTPPPDTAPLQGAARELLRRRLLDTGACAAGFATAGRVGEEDWRRFTRWLDSGRAAGLGYMHRHSALRRDPRLLLDGARTVISLAYSYAPADDEPLPALPLALYARGRDYHRVIPRLLRPVAAWLADTYGARCRICVDSAPVLERYWAMQAGIGRICDNGCVAVDGYGQDIFLAELLTTLPVAPDTPSARRCHGCGLCRQACPGHALDSPDGLPSLDCRRCLSYLTIECADPEADPPQADLLRSPRGRAAVYGCDICRRACPLDRDVPPTPVADFRTRPALTSFTRRRAADIGDTEFDTLFAGMAVRRVPPATFRLNAARGLEH